MTLTPLPAVYFMIRERQLAYQCKAADAAGPAVWRRPTTPPSRNNLLLNRGRPALSIKLPHAATGVDSNDSVVYVRAVDVACRRLAATATSKQQQQQQRKPAPVVTPLPKAVPATAAAAAAATSVAAPQYRLTTPPRQEEQPIKRSRLSAPLPRAAVPSAAAPATGAAGHLIAPDAHSSFTGPGTCGSTCRAPLPCCTPPVVVAMAPLAASTTSGMFAAHPASGAGSPLMSWLEKIKNMLSPASRHEPIFAY